MGDLTSEYDNAGFVPDAVLLNLGTNDFAHDTGPAFEAAYTAAYAQFLVDIASSHNNLAMVRVRP